MANIIRQAPVRMTSMPLYDTVRLTAVTVSTTRLFQNGIGSTADGFTPKDESCTNLSRSGGLPMGQAFRIDSVGVAIRQRNITSSPSSSISVAQALDYDFLASNTALQYQQASLIRNYGTLEAFPAGFGAAGITSGRDAGSSAVEVYTGVNGVPASGARYRLAVPITLSDGDTFGWNLVFPTAYTFLDTAGDWDISVYLWGASFQEVSR